VKAEAVQTAGGMASAAFLASGMVWLSLAAAVVGAAAGLYLDNEERPEEFGRTLMAIGAVAFLALILSFIAEAVLRNSPPLFGLNLSAVPQFVWAGLFGVFGKPIYRRLRRETAERRAPEG